ncbi:SIS domain-containing protein [Bacillus sp. SL00103]
MKHILEDHTVTQFIEQMNQAHKTVFFGAGASSFIAGDAYHKFLNLVIASLCSDPHMMNMIATHATEHDFIVAISFRESREILDAVQFAKEKGAKIASITSYPKIGTRKAI